MGLTKGKIMRRRKHFNGAVRLLAAGLCFAGFAAYPLQIEARPAETAADRVWNKVNSRTPAVSVQTNVPQKGPAAEAGRQENVMRPGAAEVPVPAQPAGYTEAEIRERMLRQYTPVKPAFRRVSGAAAGNDYKPGTMDVKIPTLFFPPDLMQEVSETFTENPDGSFGTRAVEDTSRAGYSEAAQKQMREEQWRAAKKAGQKNPVSPAAEQGKTENRAAVKGHLRTRTITVQVPVPAPSPFRALSRGDFYWFNNTKGHYLTTLPGSLSQDPLLQVPATGPMLIRTAAQNEFMAVSVDDPADTYYYKNQDTFPVYGKSLPVFTETRKSAQGDDVDIKYIRYYLGGQYCLIVDSAGKRGGKTYRVAVVFPESKQYEYLPKALYAIENLKAY